MSRSTGVVRFAPLLPFRSLGLAFLTAVLPVSPGCTSSDGESGASKASGPLVPEDDPIVRVVPLDDDASDASVLDAGRTRAAPRDGGADASVREAPEVDASRAAAPTGDATATPGAPAQVPRDAGASRTDETAASTTCVSEAPTGGGTTLRTTATEVTTAAGAVQASVRTSGTGCPPCTSRTTLAPDGETLTITFSAFDVALRGADSVSRRCDVSITLRSATGHEYAVTDFTYQGFADLESGQTARQTTRHRFAAAGGSDAPETQLTGPREGAYEYREPIAEPVWSACGPERELTISASATVDDAQRRAGSVSLSAMGAQASAKIELKLDARECVP